MNNQEQESEAMQKANAAWLAGMYCIGCQTVDVETDAMGYCASCVAAQEQFDRELEAGNIEFVVPPNPHVGDTIEIRQKRKRKGNTP